MSLKNLCIVLFWGFVFFMLGKQMWDSSTPAKPAPITYLRPIAPPVVQEPISGGANVLQTHYTTKDISSYMFEASVTLKNTGGSAASDVQIFVRPFRGGANSENPGGDSEVPEESIESHFGEWLAFPDLAPGEEKTEVIDFQNKRTEGIDPGFNREPEIHFSTKKA